MSFPNLAIAIGLRRYPVRCLTWSANLLLSLGCSNGPSRIEPPAWDPVALTAKAFEQLDADGNDLIDAGELSQAPGLASAMWHLDADQDEALSRPELQQRLELYKELGTGLISVSLRLTYRGQPLRGADVRLIPEDFLTGVIEPATGKTGADGSVTPRSDLEDLPAIRVGFYRVEVTSDHLKTSTARESAARLGIEASPVSDGNQSSGMIELSISS